MGTGAIHKVAIRPLRDDERAWANAQYDAIRFAASPPDAAALVAESSALGGRIGLGRLVRHAAGVVEMGGIWTADSARGHGVARQMVDALVARARALELAELWCIPFAHLVAFYGSCGFAAVAAPWPVPIAAKVDECIRHALPEVAVLMRPMS